MGAFHVQSARVNDGAEVWIFDNNHAPQKKNSAELRGIDIIAGNGVFYELTDDRVVLYISNPHNNPLLDKPSHVAGLSDNPYP